MSKWRRSFGATLAGSGVLPTEWFTLVFSFTRDARGRVDGFRLDSGAANGFRFTQVPAAG
jgi:hypothetical protein